MAIVTLTTEIAAPAERCFDLARHVGFHVESMQRTGERAVEGTTNGLLSFQDGVTWEARHLGRRWRMSVRITAFDRPRFFIDEMSNGPFRWLRHTHRFAEFAPGRTRMEDDLRFASPLGVVGAVFDGVYLAGYMRSLLLERNEALRAAAESDGWTKYLRNPSA